MRRDSRRFGRLPRTVLIGAWIGLAVFSLAGRFAGAPGTAGSPLVVLSFNIRYATLADGRNAWANRRDLVAAVLRDRGAAVAGLQEALKRQIEDLQDRLPGFAWFGVGRDDGRDGGEFNPVFFDASRLELLAQETFWLSETPSVAGSRGFDAACNRVVTWGKLRDRSSGTFLYVFNTHFDHVGVEARRRSAGILRAAVDRIAGPTPAVITGDFNSGAGEESYKILTAPGEAGSALSDARALSATPPFGPGFSFNGFGAVKNGAVIDFIFVRGIAAVLRSGVVDDAPAGRYASDHYAVLAEIVPR